jgi:hypothetical protein
MKFLNILFLLIFTISCATTQSVATEQKKEMNRDTIEVCTGTSPRHLICHKTIY